MHRHLLMALACLLLPVLAGAQTAAKKPHTKSFSNISVQKPARSLGARVLSNVASEPQTADAIAASTLNDLYQMGDEHFEKGEWNHTINLNQIVMEGDPHNLDTYSNNAYLLWSTDRNDLGITTLKKGLAANPDNYYMYDELGEFYWLHHKDAASALPYYEQAVKFKCPALTWHGLAHCYEKTGQWDKALTAWQTAAKYPGDAAALVNLRRVKAYIASHPNTKGQ